MSTTIRSRHRSVSAATPAKQKLRLWLRLLRTTRMIEADLRERLRIQFDSTLPRFDVLAALYRVGQSSTGKPRVDSGLTMTALSRHLLVSNGNATVVVDRLVKDGLVARVPAAKDRRSTVVSLTPEGAKLFSVMAAAHEVWIAEILVEILPADAELMMALLDRRFSPALTTGELG